MTSEGFKDSFSRGGRSLFQRQVTFNNEISTSGVGLHSGSLVSVVLEPAEANTGIKFYRSDIRNSKPIAALWQNVLDARLCTALSNGKGQSIACVEHLMAALALARIDNAIIKVDGPEVPIIDGSAAPWVLLFEGVGTIEQNEEKKIIEVLQSVRVLENERFVELIPSEVFSVEFEISFSSSYLSSQHKKIFQTDLKKEVARARTFGFEHEVAALRASGLLKGGSLDNAVVISGSTILNEGGLRYDDEFIRHKILDAVGDLYLAGGEIRGAFRGSRSGHAMNRMALQKLFSDPANWRYSNEATLLSPFSIPGLLDADGSPLDHNSPKGQRIKSDLVVANNALFEKLNRSPSLLQKLTSREFELFFASLLEKQGYKIHITPTTRDGGVDIYAASNSKLGRFLYLVECKKYSPHNPVGVGLIRQLVGVVEEKRANAGILATTSYFTKGAKEFQKTFEHRVKLVDYSNLMQWLKLMN